MKFAPGNLGVHVAVREEQVFPAIVIKIEEAHAKTEILPVDPEPSLDAGVFECAVAIVAVQRGHLFGKVCSRQIQPAVPIIVGHGHPHSG